MLGHKKICLKINDKQTVKLKSGFTEFKNYSSQIPAPFKIYADSECILKSVKNNECFSEKNIKITFHAVFITSLFVLMINLVN